MRKKQNRVTTVEDTAKALLAAIKEAAKGDKELEIRVANAVSKSMFRGECEDCSWSLFGQCDRHKPKGLL